MRGETERKVLRNPRNESYSFTMKKAISLNSGDGILVLKYTPIAYAHLAPRHTTYTLTTDCLSYTLTYTMKD